MSGPRGKTSLLVLQDELHHYDGRNYWSEWSFGRLVNAVAEHLGPTTLAVPTRCDGRIEGRHLEFGCVRFERLPGWSSMLGCLRMYPWVARRVRAQIVSLVAAHEAVLVRVPALVAALFAAEARRQRKPLIIYVCGDIRSAASPLRSWNLAVRIGAGLLSRLVHRSVVAMVRQAQLVFTAGNDLFRLCRDLNPNTCALEAGFLRAADLRARADSLPEYGPVTLFRSARITRNKGTEYLLDALGQLVSAGHDVRLKLAGGCRQPAYEAALQADCRRAGLAARVDWLGHVPFGPALFDQYASATVGVLSSLSEGFPDFIREAWAFSLPVVVARLPGLSPPVVPDENAVVTEPASGAALADGVARLLADGALRRRIIAAGFRIAQACVLEQRSRVIAERILKAVEAFHTGSATSAASSEG